MIYKFHACGHPNVLATHKTTLEFTKDKEVTLKGDCIIGVNADFDLKELKAFIRNLEGNEIKITIKTISNPEIAESLNAKVNPDFDGENEIVIRKTGFLSKRTLATGSDKAAFELKKDLIGFLKEKDSSIEISIE